MEYCESPFANVINSFFCSAVSVGRGSSSPIKGAKLPEITDAEPWDGKDGEVNWCFYYSIKKFNRNVVFKIFLRHIFSRLCF